MKLNKKIQNEIKSNNGFITIKNFIRTSMYDEKKGYYKNKRAIGKKGDFITSSEISQLFGEIIGLYFIDYWSNYIKDEFNLIELGPGNGTFIRDALNISLNFENYFSSINLNLIEVNKELIKIQKKNLNIFKKKSLKMTWQQNLKKINKKKSIVFANEFFDCFPISQFYKFKNEYFEKIIKYDEKNKKFYFDDIKLNKNLKLFNKIESLYSSYNLKDKSIIEIEYDAEKYLESISEIIKKNGGLFVIIDYGNYSSSGFSTIQSVSKHKKVDFLNNVGKQDISHMLDFNYFYMKLKSLNLNVYGPFTQRNFLISIGINELKNKICKNVNTKKKLEIQKDLDRILDENKMGELFKVLIISSQKLENYEKVNELY